MENSVIECDLQHVLSSKTKDWEILLNGKTFTDGLTDEQSCIDEICSAKDNGYSGKWSYREFITTISIGRSVVL